jgi:prevent-host-death family protein
MTNVTIAEGKKNFSRLINESLEKEEEILVTRRGRPVVVIIPYEQYQRSRKRQGYEKIMEVKKEFEKSGIAADKIFKESKRQLEKRI